MIASAMEVIYQDEKNHYKEAASEAARGVQNKQDLTRMKEAVREMSLNECTSAMKCLETLGAA